MRMRSAMASSAFASAPTLTLTMLLEFELRKFEVMI